MNEYFDELLQMLQWGNFEILAHITYPFRYIFNLCGYVEDINKYSKKIDEILKLCAEKDKALEINMGGLKYPINKPAPDIDTIKRYKELGGRLVSVGSDSHYAERIGFGIPRAYEMAREAGFDFVARFKERKAFEFAIK
jgi:histidinol-phosphatase (PHP family)